MAEPNVAEDKKTPETQQEIQRFPPEVRELLEGGFEILELTGKTYEEIVQAHPDIRFKRNFERYGEGTGGNAAMDLLEAMRSRRTEVAIPRYDPIFLPGSNVSKQEQGEMIKESSRGKDIPGAKLERLDTLDYAELGALYAERHVGGSLYGRWNDRKQASTESGLSVGSMPKEGSDSAEILISDNTSGGMNNEGPWAAPVVVPI